MNKIITWDIYEITTQESIIKGVMLRGRIRKYGLENGFNILTENATDKDNCVRFALIENHLSSDIITFIKSIVNDANIELIAEKIKNPVLSKMKVNKGERYTIEDK